MADGRIDIDTKINSSGMGRGTKTIAKQFDGLISKVKTFGAVMLDTTVGAVNMGKNAIAGFARFAKKALIGGLLLMGASVAVLFRGLRDSVNELINVNMKGTPLFKDVEDIKAKFSELKMAVAVAFLPLIQFAIPYIKQALDWMIALFNKVAMITGALMGQKEVLQVVVGSAKKIADSNKKTEKAVRGQLAAFDEINVLQQQSKDAASADAGASPTVTTKMTPITDEVLEKVETFKGKIDDIKERWNEFIARVVNSEPWQRLKEFTAAEWEDMKRGWANTVLFVHNEWEDVKTQAASTWKFIKDDFALLSENLKTGWQRVKIFTKAELLDIKTAGKNTWQFIQDDFALLETNLKKGWENTKTFTTNEFTDIKNFGHGTWEFIKADFALLGLSIKTTWQNVSTWFQTAWATLWNGINEVSRNVINTVTGFFYTMINGIISKINEALNLLTSLTNFQFTMPSYLPTYSYSTSGSVGGRTPHLASGAVIPPNAAFAAILGDQRNGTNIEAPADLIRQIVAEEIGNIQADIKIDFGGSMGELVRLLRPEIIREDVRVGRNLAKSAT